MSFMWHAETFQADAPSIAVTAPAAESGDRQLRAMVWGALIAANLVASVAIFWFVGAAIL
jgi:hypothetical protein